MHLAARKRERTRETSTESDDSDSDQYTTIPNCVIDYLVELQSQQHDKSWDDEMTAEMVSQ